ncbi:MAG TPA: thioredoxin domain-containing protein [Terriglobales bacterium]|nr:thioredoxin domain-containing protein [Terriglobales bacterium]
MTFFQRATIVFLLICLGCSAQSAPSDVAHKVERHVRAYYNLPPDVQVTVGPLKSSEFPNYDALVVTLNNSERKQDVDFLLSKDRNQLIRITKLDLTKDPYTEVMKKIDTSGRPTRGNKDAKVVAVNYDDFECPYCSRMHQSLFPAVFKEYGDRVLFIYKDFPLVEIHPWAMRAAVNANCLAAQSNDAYWDFADYIHANRSVVDSEKTPDARNGALDKITLEQGQKHNVDAAKLQACIKAQNQDAVRASMREADGLGISATPTMFINGEKVDGALPPPMLRAVLDRALKDAGVAPPPPAAPSANPGSAGPAAK